MKEPHRSNPGQQSRLNLVLLVTLALLLIAASVVLVLTIPKSEALPTDTGPSITSTATLAGFETDAVEAQQLVPFASGVVKLTANRVAYLDMMGAEIYSVDAEMSAPFAVTQGDRLLAGDKDGHSYILLSPGGEISRGSTTGILRGAAIAPDGHFALITDPTESTGVVKIFEPVQGKWLFDCLFPDSGFVLSVAFTKDSQAFDVSLLNTNGSKVHPILKRLSITGQTLGQRILDDAQIYPQIVYDQDGMPVLCGNAGIVAVSYEKADPLYQVSLPSVRSVSGSDSGLLILYAETTDGRQRLTIRTADGKQSEPIAIGDETSNLAVNGKYAVIGSGTRIFFIDLAQQAILEERNMATEIIRVGFATDGTLTVVMRNGVRQLTIPK